MVKKIRTIIERISTYLAVTFLLGLVLLSFTQVVLRNVFSIAFNIIEVIIRNAVLWITFLGALLASVRGKHISIDVLPIILERRKHQKTLKALNFLVNLIVTLIGLIFTYLSIKFIIMEIESGAYIGGLFPAWIAEIIIPIGFLLLSLTFFLKLLDRGDTK